LGDIADTNYSNMFIAHHYWFSCEFIIGWLCNFLDPNTYC
jgi:hypothetical protein